MFVPSWLRVNGDSCIRTIAFKNGEKVLDATQDLLERVWGLEMQSKMKIGF